MDQRQRWYAGRQRPLTAALVVGAGLIAVACIALILLVWIDPKTPSERTDVIKTAAQVAGGVVLLIGLFFTYRTVKASQETLKVGIDKLNLDRETQLNERFLKASERLGNESEGVRIGALLSLERLAHDSERERKSIITLLCVFVRRRAPQRVVRTDGHAADDVQAAIRVIGGLGTYYQQRVGAPSVGLEFADLRKLRFEGGSFRGANFFGCWLNHAAIVASDWAGANAQKASLNDSWFVFAGLQHAKLIEADLSRAKLFYPTMSKETFQSLASEESFAEIQREWAFFEGVSPELGAHDYDNGHLLEGLDLTGAILTETDLTHADLRSVKRLTRKQLDEAICGPYTFLPSYLSDEVKDEEGEEDKESPSQTAG